MKTTIKRTIEEEVELAFPMYRKEIAHRVKIIDEKSAIVVMRGYNDRSLGVELRDYMPNEWIHKTEATEQEFTEWFNEAMELLKLTINK